MNQQLQHEPLAPDRRAHVTGRTESHVSQGSLAISNFGTLSVQIVLNQCVTFHPAEFCVDTYVMTVLHRSS